MTEEKTPPPDGDIDWDEALAEWDERAFSPEVAASVAAEAAPPPPAPPVRTLDPAPEPADAAGRPEAAGVEATPDLSETPADSIARCEVAPVRPDESRSWNDEKPAAAWLDESARSALEDRARWLEEEARALPDPVARARSLLACSEVLATAGETGRAHALAVEARDLAPGVVLAHRQARALSPLTPELEELVAALDAEGKATPAGPGRVHALLLAADHLQRHGEQEAATRRFEQALRSSPTDLRAAVERASIALRSPEAAMPRFPAGPEMEAVEEAVSACLGLQGRGRSESATARSSPAAFLRSAREALARGDLAAAGESVHGLGAASELAGGATWLAAALAAPTSSRRRSLTWLSDLVERGDESARRPAIARAIELGDRAFVLNATADPARPLPAPERLVLATLAGSPPSATDPDVATAAREPGMGALASAVVATGTVGRDAEHEGERIARSSQTSGTGESRALVRVGRLLAAGAGPEAFHEPLETLGESRAASLKAVALEMALRAERLPEVSARLQAWGTERGSLDERTSAALAAGVLAERAGDRERALQAYGAARDLDPTCEAALRAQASLGSLDLPMELSELADALGQGLPAALARIEAVARSQDTLPDPTRADLLERAHHAAPGLRIPAFLAEQMARGAGDASEVVRWIRERRGQAADPTEAAFHGVREALCIAAEEPEVASELLLEAHRASPDDVALRELLERTSPAGGVEAAAWRERRATEVKGDARALMLLEAAHEYERAGDDVASLRCAEAAAGTDLPLARVALERAEMRTGRVARLAEDLLAQAKTAEDPVLRREAYERLALLDATIRRDPASALLWHRWILEELPDYKPSLRHLEHFLIGAGRDEELEPIATAIAGILRGSGSGECTAHAELAARLRMRNGAGGWEATRDMAELAFAEGAPPLWSLRLLHAHASAASDDETLLMAIGQIIDRVSRPAELSTLLVRAAEAAMRLDRAEEAVALLVRATTEAPDDTIAWQLLADASRKAGDARRAAEACEALARCHRRREEQIRAWYEAGRTWLDEVGDADRATAAFEAVAASDVEYEDAFERLSRIYASRKMHAELAGLLAARLSRVTDPQERLALGVRRGKVLLETGDAEGARQAFAAALEARPDDPEALSALVDLCIAEGDWAAAEQALTRLARILPTPARQAEAYARLSDLYAHHLLNLSRAEGALREVLTRAPDDQDAIQKLVDVHRRQNDAARAAQLQQDLVGRARSPEEKRARLLELSSIHENIGHDNRRAEQALETARRELPRDVTVLRALAEFYGRHHQPAAANIILDRAAADARRDLAAGRWAKDSFEVLSTVFDLRGRKGAARTTRAMLDALQGSASDLPGAGERAFDPKLDEVVAPEAVTPALRNLLARAGAALDAASPLDLRTLRAAPARPDSPAGRLAAKIGSAVGLTGLQVLVSPKLGAVCLAAGSTPPVILMGESLGVDRGGSFQVLRALKLLQVRASALARTPPAELSVLVAAWLRCFNPTWKPKDVPASAVEAAVPRVQAALPRSTGGDLGVVALEVAGSLEGNLASVGPAAVAWANRVALLAIGSPAMALDAIAASLGSAGGAPTDPGERLAWIGRTQEARDLLAFGVSDAFAEARSRLGLDR